MVDIRFEQGGVEQRRIQDLHRRSEKVDNIRYYNQAVGAVMKIWYGLVRSSIAHDKTALI